MYRETGNIKLNDPFFNPYYKLVHQVMLPYQWEVLNDLVEGAEKSHCIENIRIAAGLSEGEFHGFLFQDSDAAKWIEALAYCIKNGDARTLEEHADDVIKMISMAQKPDGYFNSYFQLTGPERVFTNLFEAHELYCLGHFIEAAVAYQDATGKKELMNIVRKFSDLVDHLFGPEEGKSKGCPGHQEIELALVKLYEATGEERYLKLGKFFLDVRGPEFFTEEWEAREGFSEWSKRKEKIPEHFKYNQAHKPVREQTEAVGHAVRAVYMYTAMAEIGRLTNDEYLLTACRKLFQDVCRQLYVTGGIGSTNHGEAFTFAYDLPNEINYSETCASIGLVFFMHSMLKAEPNSAYADVMERALYNTVLSGIGTDGSSYFYVNPMEVLPRASEENPARTHVKATRQKWHACACCPPNAARLLADLGKYLCTTCVECNEVYFHLYAGSDGKAEMSAGTMEYSVDTQYPLDGDIAITIKSAPIKPVTMAFRIPDWCEDAAFWLADKIIKPELQNGYARISHTFIMGDTIRISFPMKPRLVYAHTQVRADAGKACVQRGPLVYCLEECDNGTNLHALLIGEGKEFTEKWGTVGGMRCVTLKTAGYVEADAEDGTYSFLPKTRESKTLTFVPYHLWGNREAGEMLVWVRKER